jgi:hypothetical protein
MEMKSSLRALTTALALTVTLALPANSSEGAPLAWSRMGQAGVGLVLGVTGTYLGAAAGKAIDPCNEKKDEENAIDLCNSSGTTIGAIGGYLLGTTAGVYGAGRLFGREGSLWMTAGGAALGLLAGGLLSTQFDETPAFQVISLLALSQGLALFGNYWSDRVKINAELETVPRKTGQVRTSTKPNLALRPEVEVTLARF